MRNLTLIILLLFLSSCGYSSIYKNQQSLDFQLNIIGTEGDYEMNNLISNEIKLNSNKDSQNVYDINIDTDYKKDILDNESLIVTIEAGNVSSWKKYLGQKGLALGIDRFGESAPYKKVYEHLNLSVEKIVLAIQKNLRN